MQLNIDRFFSDRLIFDSTLKVANVFWSSSEENRQTIRCFKKYLIDRLGEARLQRICSRYSLDLDAMEKRGSPLRSRHVAQIVIGARNVTVEDINEKSGKLFSELDSATLSGYIDQLSNEFANDWQVPDIEGRISGRATEKWARTFFDPFLADRERIQLCREHPKDSFPIFMHNMTAYVIKREMDVGTLIPAPNRADGTPQYYYVSGKVVTGEGMVSYILEPATKDCDLKSVRLFRGTAARTGEIDGISSLITDFEYELGRRAYESGEIYESFIPNPPAIEAGHSLGSNIIQWRLANRDHIKEAYLFCGPGIPMREVEKFNQKNLDVLLHIRHSRGDRCTSTGDAHLGYKAPENVRIDFLRYHAPRKMNESVHVAVFPKIRKSFHGIEGGKLNIDEEFFSKDRAVEWVRYLVGVIFSRFLLMIRFIYSCFAMSRADLERGIKIGRIEEGRWQVDHFRGFEYTSKA